MIGDGIGHHVLYEDGMRGLTACASHPEDPDHMYTSGGIYMSVIVGMDLPVVMVAFWAFDRAEIDRSYQQIIIFLVKGVDFCVGFYYYHIVRWNGMIIKLWSARWSSLFLCLSIDIIEKS